MKKTLLILLNFIFILTYSLPAQEASEVRTGDLKVIIKGFENEKGKALIALSNSKENYDAMKEPFKGAKVEIKNRQAEVIFKDLPLGEYAIKAFHDENDDQELDTNFLGMPTENYGFSNNARGSFGPASWQDAKFKLNSAFSSTEIMIH
jgi:uncharacterized protein (DUF2141 family)